VYNILPYIYMHLLVLISYLIAQCKVMDYLKFVAWFVILRFALRRGGGLKAIKSSVSRFASKPSFEIDASKIQT
jgi:hypothetical protein